MNKQEIFKALGTLERVEQFKVKNQFSLIYEKGTIFQSYQSIIAIELYATEGKKVFLDKSFWNYSVTTSKYRNLFLCENSEKTKKKIQSGEYELASLN